MSEVEAQGTEVEAQEIEETEEAQTQATSAETLTTESEPGPVPYARFKQVNQELADLRKQIKGFQKAEVDAKRAAEEAQRKAAEEQGKFKELYEQEVARREAAEAEAKRLELGALKSKVAAEVGLPPALATRLQGETEDELKVDAQAVLAALPKSVVGNDAQQGIGGAVQQAPTMTDADIQEFAARYNVDPRYVKPEMFRLPKK